MTEPVAIRSLWHEAPGLLEFEAAVLDARPGRVRLSRSAFYPGGGGQPADRGVLRWAGGEARVARIETEGGVVWHVLAEPVLIETAVLGVVDAAFRRLMCQLHTDLHIVNALAFQAFDGALVTLWICSSKLHGDQSEEGVLPAGKGVSRYFRGNSNRQGSSGHSCHGSAKRGR